ncbi:MAG: DEAD/DEAH box helicase family protein [Caldilineaceae bacterium]|nr:DEAD/DEAH box helicase family protein [Caldilineaceae bacterium]
MQERIFVALDLETTGLDANRDRIIEIGAVRFQGNQILDTFITFVNPQRAIPLRIQQITGIRDKDVANAPTIEQIIPELLAFVSQDVTALVAHNASFDMGFLQANGVEFHRPALDTFELASILLPGCSSYSLGALCAEEAIVLDEAHRALDDARATALLFMRLTSRLADLPAATLAAIVEAGQSAGRITNWPPYLLFEDACRRATTLGHTLPASRPSNGHSAPAEPMDAPLAIEPAAFIDAAFAPDGPLVQLLDQHLLDQDNVEQRRGYELRPGQIKMAQSVYQAFAQNEHLLVEAGTGTGKSLAYLLPAALYSMTTNQRVVVATNTIALQDQLLNKEVPTVTALAHRLLKLPPGKELRTILLKGRANYLCPRRLEQWRRGRLLSPVELKVLAKVLVWLPTTRTGDVEELFLPSPAEQEIWRRIASDPATCTEERCAHWQAAHATGDFYFQARRQAESAHILVINHALLLADLANEGQILPAFKHLVVDEAHHLEQAATDQLTYQIAWPQVDQWLDELIFQNPLIEQVVQTAGGSLGAEFAAEWLQLSARVAQTRGGLAEFAQRLRNFAFNQDGVRADAGYVQRIHLDDSVRTQPRWSQLEVEWENVSSRLKKLLRDLQGQIERLLAANWLRREPHGSLLGALSGIHNQLNDIRRQVDEIILSGLGAKGGIVSWMEIDERGQSVSLFAAPVSVSHLLEESFVRQKQTAIFTGATLRTGADFEYTKERLGLWDVPAMNVRSPFNYEKNTLLYMPSDLPEPNHPHYQRAVEQAIIATATATEGRTMALFTSYAQLRTTADAIRAPLDRRGITVLQHGVSSRRRLLREYRATEKAVLLGTRTFWEGIDLPGDELLSLLIVRLPFAPPGDPLVAARCAELDNAFNEYTLPDAILRFRQGFGRLIRRTDDRGVVVLLDSRIWQKRYGQSFLDAIPRCTEKRAPLSNLREEIELWMMGAE